MAIAHDASTEHGGTNGATSVSWAHTCSGAQRILTVGLCTRFDIDSISLTYAGIAMTSWIAKEQNVNASNVYMFYLFAPPKGSNTIAASWTNDSGDGVFGAISFTGVGAVLNSTSTGGVSTSSSLNVTSKAGYVAVDAIQVDAGGSNPTKGASQSYGWQDANPDNQNSGGMSYRLATGTPTNMSWTFGNATFSHVAGALVPAVNTKGLVAFYSKMLEEFVQKGGIMQPRNLGLSKPQLEGI